eukprot:NODE_60_length_25605_cov_0.732377.p14 type:complete len:104 gc:universal NODE_60_length_25605_cov_0.732377:6454-6143(-)
MRSVLSSNATLSLRQRCSEISLLVKSPDLRENREFSQEVIFQLLHYSKSSFFHYPEALLSKETCTFRYILYLYGLYIYPNDSFYRCSFPSWFSLQCNTLYTPD